MFIAHYAANNQYEQFDTFKEAKEYLEECWNDDGSDDGSAEETIRGEDFIAEVTRVSKYVEIENKIKGGYKFDEKLGCSINSSGEE